MCPKDLLLEVFPRLADVAGRYPSARSHGENVATPQLFVFRLRIPKAINVHIPDGSASNIMGIVNLQRADDFEGKQGAPRIDN